MRHSLASASAPDRCAPCGAPSFRDRLLRLFGRPARSAAEEARAQALREASALREVALCLRATSPGFASDLMAAAARHELAFEGGRGG